VLEETGTEEELRRTVPDLKESLEIGRDDQPETPNMWPSGDEEAAVFRKQMMGFFETCKNLHMQVMRAIALGMGIEERWFDEFTDAGDNTLRLLHYPGVSKTIFKRNDGQLQVRAGEHSDYGMVTMAQDLHSALTRFQAPLPSSSRTFVADSKFAHLRVPLWTLRP
jgi:isopenicillin N synthase-like dioxygenase